MLHQHLAAAFAKQKFLQNDAITVGNFIWRLGVFRDRVLLYADCEEVGSEPLEIRGPLDVNGKISIAKLAGSNSQTVPVSRNLMHHFAKHFVNIFSPSFGYA